MKVHLPIFGELFRKTLCIALAMAIGFGFLAVGAMANSCNGGIDCWSCAAAAHSHSPGMDVEMVSRACESTEQNSSCGLETGPSGDEFDRLAAVAESGGNTYSGIFSVASEEFDPSYGRSRFLTQFQYSHRGESTPIYLRNHSLLC